MTTETPAPDPAPMRSRATRFEPRLGGRQIDDEDFDHDALLRIDGDFGSDEERMAYARFICDKLNAPAIPAPGGAPSDAAVELAAKAVYRLFIGADLHPWVEGGNSLMQCDARRYARAALAAPAPQAPAWQPIETAPKDGTRFLAMNDGWHEFFHWQDGANEHTKGWPTGWRSAFTVYREGTGPTHWMPLPAAPQTKEPTHDR